MEVVGEAPNGGDAVEKGLMNAPKRGAHGHRHARPGRLGGKSKIKKNRPETKVLFLTMCDDEGSVVEGMEVGASIYV